MNQHIEKSVARQGLPRESSRALRAIRICLAGMILCAIVTALRTTDVFAKGPVTFSETEFNFGQLPANSFTSHTFWIHASGSDTIVIDTVLPGCGCTSIPFSKKTLAPGDSVAFEIVFDSKGIIGSVAKKPGFRLRGDSAKYDVKFYASVITKEEQYFPLTIMPPIFILPEKEARSGKEFSFQLYNRSDESISVDIVDYAAEIFAVEMPDSIAAEGTISGHFSLLPGFPESEDIFKSITFEVNHSQLYRLTAPIVMKSLLGGSIPKDTTSPSSADSAKQRR